MLIAYLKFQLVLLKTEGVFCYERLWDTIAEEIAYTINEDVNIVKLLLTALDKANAIEFLNKDTLLLTEMQDLIGSEGSSAARVRKHREKYQMLQCNTPVTLSNGDVTTRNTEKEIEIYKELIDRFIIILLYEKQKPSEFNQKQYLEFIKILENLDLYYNKKTFEIMTSEENKNKIKAIIYIIKEIYLSEYKYLLKSANREDLIDVYTNCKNYQNKKQNTKNEIQNFYNYYKKSLIERLSKS